MAKKIITRYKDEQGDIQTIVSDGLGGLGWDLDSLGCDSASENESFKVVSIFIEDRNE